MPKTAKTEEPKRLPGRPPSGNADGNNRFRFDADEIVAEKIREKHAAAFLDTGISIGPWLLRQVCKALDINVTKRTRARR